MHFAGIFVQVFLDERVISGWSSTVSALMETEVPKFKTHFPVLLSKIKAIFIDFSKVQQKYPVTKMNAHFKFLFSSGFVENKVLKKKHNLTFQLSTWTEDS